MSGTDNEDRAGLFVLGALNAEEMRAVRAEAERDPVLSAEIAAWERRLTPLVALVPAAELPASIWPQLETRLARLSAPGQAQAEIYQPPLRQRTKRRSEVRALAFWRTTALAAMSAAAVLGGMLIMRKPAAPPVLAMIMPAQPGVGGWLITLRGDGTLHAVAQGCAEPYDGPGFRAVGAGRRQRPARAAWAAGDERADGPAAFGAAAQEVQAAGEFGADGWLADRAADGAGGVFERRGHALECFRCG